MNIQKEMVEYLQKLTNANIYICIDAVSNSRSLEEAWQKITNKDTKDYPKKIKRGMIVKVIRPITSPVNPGYITKVLAVKKSNNDNILVNYGNSKLTKFSVSANAGTILLLEEDENTEYSFNNKYRNVKFVYEYEDAVMPASKMEKKNYRKSKRRTKK
ncbi:MAG: hypothetical protein ACOCV1_07680 [Bacillota bacterium]